MLDSEFRKLFQKKDGNGFPSPPGRRVGDEGLSRELLLKPKARDEFAWRIHLSPFSKITWLRPQALTLTLPRGRG
jgi:hypothetical protein